MAKRHRWEMQAKGAKCVNCGTKVGTKLRPSKKDKSKKVPDPWYQTKGGPQVQGTPGPCQGA